MASPKHLRAADPFSRLLPEHLTLEIFSHLDVKSLKRCISTCKLFSRLVPLTPSVSVSVSLSFRPEYRFYYRPELITDLFQDLAFSISSSSSLEDDDDDERVGIIILTGRKRTMPMRLKDIKYSFIGEKLKGFVKIQTLRIDLYCFEAKSNKYCRMIKWKASFGSEGIESCYILGVCSSETGDDEVLFPLTKDKSQQRMTLGWASDCLESEWAMHYILNDVIQRYPTIGDDDAVVRDAEAKGKVVFRKESVAEMLKNSRGGAATQMLAVKLWYVAGMELPQSGCVMRGVTLIAIKPDIDDDSGFLEEAFDDDDDDGECGVRVGEFVKEMRKMMDSPSIRLPNAISFPRDRYF